jgi:membrane dipeptidase
MVIDGLQYANWSEKVFRQMREGGVDAVHVTIAYHEMFRETVANIEAWNRWFERFPDLICHAKTGEDVRRAKAEGRTAIVFGAQTPAPIEDDIGLVEILHTLGLRFMQLSYNNQSLLATGCYEAEDPGLTRMGREVIAEMNRVGLVVDMSHSAERSTLEAMEVSPAHRHHPCQSRVLAPGQAQQVRHRPARIGGDRRHAGLFALSPPPQGRQRLHACGVLRDDRPHGGDDGGRRLGIGSDLCQDQPDSVVEWMRVGRWTKRIDYGEGSAAAPGFPPQPDFFRDNRDFPRLHEGLARRGVRRGERDCYSRRQLAEVFRREFREEPLSELRDPDQVMRLRRMGASHPTRLSFMRVLLRGLRRGGWKIDRTEWNVDAAGVGHAVYRAQGQGQTYSLVAFAHDLPDHLRSDRVIAEAWDHLRAHGRRTRGGGYRAARRQRAPAGGGPRERP